MFTVVGYPPGQPELQEWFGSYRERKDAERDIASGVFVEVEPHTKGWFFMIKP